MPDQCPISPHLPLGEQPKDGDRGGVGRPGHGSRTQERRSADAEGRAGVTSHTSTTFLPKLCPVNMPWKAAGKFSNPSATWVLNFMLPSESGVSSSSRISATKCSHDELRWDWMVMSMPT